MEPDAVLTSDRYLKNIYGQVENVYNRIKMQDYIPTLIVSNDLLALAVRVWLASKDVEVDTLRATTGENSESLEDFLVRAKTTTGDLRFDEKLGCEIIQSDLCGLSFSQIEVRDPQGIAFYIRDKNGAKNGVNKFGLVMTKNNY